MKIYRYPKHQKGFSLIELVIVLLIIVIVAAIAVGRIFFSDSEVGGGERLLSEVSSRIASRRTSAIRLNGDDRRLPLIASVNVPLLPIDFENVSTASLRIEGVDKNNDCLEDNTGLALTCLKVVGQQALWELAFEDDVMEVPQGWELARNPLEVPPISQVPGRGIMATAFAFDATGRAYARETDSLEWKSIPTGALRNTEPNLQEIPFWAIYFVARRNEAFAAVAVAVHPSGVIEKYRYDNGVWLGYQNRVNK